MKTHKLGIVGKSISDSAVNIHPSKPTLNKIYRDAGCAILQRKLSAKSSESSVFQTAYSPFYKVQHSELPDWVIPSIAALFVAICGCYVWKIITLNSEAQKKLYLLNEM